MLHHDILRAQVELLCQSIIDGTIEDHMQFIRQNANPLAPQDDVKLYLSMYEKLMELKPIVEAISERGKELHAKIAAAAQN